MKRVLIPLLAGILAMSALLLAVHGFVHHLCMAYQQPSGTSISRNPPTAPVLPWLKRWENASAAGHKSAFLDELSFDDALSFLTEIEATHEAPAQLESTRQLAFDRLSEHDPVAALKFAQTNWPGLANLTRISNLLLRLKTEHPDEAERWLASYEASLSKQDYEDNAWRSFKQRYWATPSKHPTENELTATWQALRATGDLKANSGGHDGRIYDKDRNVVASVNPLISVARGTGQWSQMMDKIVAAVKPDVGIIWPVIQSWMQDDFDAAAAWVMDHPAKAEREQFRFAMLHSPNNDDLRQFTDYQRIFNWVRQVDPDSLGATFFWWSDYDSASASKWLSEQPAMDTQLDELRYSLAVNVAREDTVAALAWLSAIGDKNRREAGERKACRYWSQVEPWAAKAWIQEHQGLTPEAAREYLRDE